MAVIGDRIEHEIRIEAPPESVFTFFVDPVQHSRWIGRHSTLDPRPGGIYRCVMHERATVLGSFQIVDPPRRVVFTWGFEDNADLPPGSSTVEVTLTADADATVVRLVHTGLPHPALMPHDTGWHGYLGQLGQLADAAA